MWIFVWLNLMDYDTGCQKRLDDLFEPGAGCLHQENCTALPLAVWSPPELVLMASASDVGGHV